MRNATMKTSTAKTKHANEAIALAMSALGRGQKKKVKAQTTLSRALNSSVHRVKISRWVKTHYNVTVSKSA